MSNYKLEKISSEISFLAELLIVGSEEYNEDLITTIKNQTEDYLKILKEMKLENGE